MKIIIPSFTLLVIFLFQSPIIVKNYSFENKGSQIVKDSLINYSYILNVKSNDSVSNGTCFFYRKNNKIYLVTAYHCLITYTEKEGNYYKSKLNIRSYNGRTNFDIIVKISNINPVSINDNWDIYSVQIDDSIKNIYCINNLINPKIAGINPSKTICFGYHGLSQRSVEIPQIFRFESSLSSTTEYMKLILEKFPNIPKKDFERVRNNVTRDYCFIKGEDSVWYGGYSGSPVFGEYVYNSKKNYYFLGLLAAGTTDYKKSKNLLATLKLKTVLEYFEKYI